MAATAPPPVRTPFERFSSTSRRATVVVTLLGVVVLGAIMLDIGRPMDDNGHNIVELELAGTADRVDTIMSDWGVEGRHAARRQTILDYAWAFLYATCLAAALSHLSARIRHPHMEEPLPNARLRRRADWAARLAWAALAAGALDMLENTFLWLQINGGRGALPALAFVSAAAKFALLAACLAMLVYGFTARALATRR